MAKIVVVPGQKFGKLTIIEEVEFVRDKHNQVRRMVKVKCDCGNVVIKNLGSVSRLDTKSCGCMPYGKRPTDVNIGEKYSKLTIIEEIEPVIYNGIIRRRIKVQCDCGKIFDVDLSALRTKNTKSCGCASLNGNRQHINKNYNGVKFSYLTVIGEVEGRRKPSGSIVRVMECKCDCGKVKTISLGDLKSGRTQSCGCYKSVKSSEANSKHIEIGQTRGHLTLMEEVDKVTKMTERGSVSSTIRYVMVKCNSCGYVEEMTLRRFLVDELPDHCGCLNAKFIIDRLNSKNIEMERFNRLNVIKEVNPVEYYKDSMGKVYQQRMVEYECDCGNIGEHKYKDILMNNLKSCGCKEHIMFHGLCTKEETNSMYARWKGMISRCYNPRDPAYQHYGGRGIKVCDRWRDSPENFVIDMGLPPTWEHTNDRIDVDGMYEPSNCRWADQQTQATNRRTSKWYKEGKKNPTI